MGRSTRVLGETYVPPRAVMVLASSEIGGGPPSARVTRRALPGTSLGLVAPQPWGEGATGTKRDGGRSVPLAPAPHDFFGAIPTPALCKFLVRNRIWRRSLAGFAGY